MEKTLKKKAPLRRFLKSYLPYLDMFAFDMLCSLFIAAIGIAVPLIVRNLLYKGIQTAASIDMRYILTLGGLILFLRLVECACEYFVATVGHVMGAKIERDMRKALFDKFLTLPHSYYDDAKVGQLMSRLTSDLFDVTELAHHAPEEYLIATVKIVGSFIILSGLHLYLTLIMFAILPFMALFAFRYNMKMRRAAYAQRQEIANINAQIEDSLAGVRVVKSFTGEHIEQEKFSHNNNKFLMVKRGYYRYMGVFHSGLTLFNGIMYLACVVCGCLFINKGELTAVDLIAFLMYADILLSTVRDLCRFTEQFQLGMTGIVRFYEIMDTPASIESPLCPVTLGNVRGNVAFCDVSFTYSGNDREVLSHINLDVKRGETVALVGPSGSGKTTVCNLIPRFYDVRSGKITVDGVDVRDLSLEELRKNIGVVQQDVYLFYGTVYDNITYGKRDATREEVEAAAKRSGAYDFVMALPNGFETIVGERGVKLSGGQKQRISIARVFLKNPPITILDEATSSLDTESEKLVQRSLDELSKERTTFIIAHRLTTVRNADKIVVLTDKGIEEIGSHEELMEKRGVYYHLYNM